MIVRWPPAPADAPLGDRAGGRDQLAQARPLGMPERLQAPAVDQHPVAEGEDALGGGVDHHRMRLGVDHHDRGRQLVQDVEQGVTGDCARARIPSSAPARAPRAAGGGRGSRLSASPKTGWPGRRAAVRYQNSGPERQTDPAQPMQQALRPQVVLIEFGLHQLGVEQNVLARHDRERLIQPCHRHPRDSSRRTRPRSGRQDRDPCRSDAGRRRSWRQHRGGQARPPPPPERPLQPPQDLLPGGRIRDRLVDQVDQLRFGGRPWAFDLAARMDCPPLSSLARAQPKRELNAWHFARESTHSECLLIINAPLSTTIERCCLPRFLLDQFRAQTPTRAQDHRADAWVDPVS